MTAEDWYNEWSFGIKIEWKDLSPETRQFWEKQFEKYQKDVNENLQGGPGS